MTNSLNRRSARLLAIIAMLPVFTLSGCGQKGPLYLPGNPSEIKTEVSKHESKQESAQDSSRDLQQELPASDQQDQDDDEDPEKLPE